MKVGFKYKAEKSVKKKRIDWKKRLINIIGAMLIANFLWDTYDRVPQIKIYSDQYYQDTVKYSKIYYNKALGLLKKNQED